MSGAAVPGRAGAKAGCVRSCVSDRRDSGTMTATLLTPEQKARLVLEVFASLGRRPGETLTADDFVAVARRRGLRTDDLADGIEQGELLGWFDRTAQGAIRFTPAGFAESLERF